MRQSLIIMTLCVISPLLLTSCWWNKIPENTNDTSSVQSRAEIPYTIDELESMFDEERKKTLQVASEEVEIQDISSYLMSGPRNIQEMIASLSGTNTHIREKKAYLQSFIGDYSGALMERAALCEVDETYCTKKTITVSLGGFVDDAGQSISPESNVYIDTQEIPLDSSITQADLYSDMIHRVRVEKEGYLDAFAKIIPTSEGDPTSITLEPVLARAGEAVVVDNQVGGTYSVGSGASMITYTIFPDTFATQDGKIVQGKVQVYLFSLNSENQDLSVFGLDTFGDNGMSLGGSMITDGMPFITAYQSGRELTIVRDIEGIGTLQLNQMYADITSVPKNIWLTNDELIDYALPGYWTLDRKSGVWKESKMQVLDNEGSYKFLFR